MSTTLQTTHFLVLSLNLPAIRTLKKCLCSCSRWSLFFHLIKTLFEDSLTGIMGLKLDKKNTWLRFFFSSQYHLMPKSYFGWSKVKMRQNSTRRLNSDCVLWIIASIGFRTNKSKLRLDSKREIAFSYHDNLYQLGCWNYLFILID